MSTTDAARSAGKAGPQHAPRGVVIYESMFGNTRQIAEAIAAGMSAHTLVRVVPVSQATAGDLADVDLLVIGAPTHAWGLSRPSTRKGAEQQASKPDSGLTLEPGATGPGVREWVAAATALPPAAVVFETKLHAPLGLSGSAARKLSRRLKQRGVARYAPSNSFFVTKANRLDDGELARATSWGEQLVTQRAQRSA